MDKALKTLDPTLQAACVWLTGHGEGDLLCLASGLVLGHAGVGAWISPLCGTEDQIQAILVHSALCGHPLTSSLPPDLGLRSAARGATGYPLEGVRCENLGHLGHHVVYLCSGKQRERDNFQCEAAIWTPKLISIYRRPLIIINLSSKPAKHYWFCISQAAPSALNSNSVLFTDFLSC